MTKKAVIILGLVLIVLLAIPSLLFIFKSETYGGPVACTMEAKICPDGSAVGRSGPLCEFAACPSVKEENMAKLGQRIWTGKIAITPLEVIEESRCPIDVMCIQAGTVRLMAKLEYGGIIEEKVLKLGEPIVFNGVNVEMYEVFPMTNSKKIINKTDYRFYFR